MFARTLTTLTVVLLALAFAPFAAADDLQAFLEQTLAAARDKNHVPAVAALVQIDGKRAAEAAVGVRALGHAEKVTTNDRWHIGSDTKAFTSTTIARLVEAGVMRFDDTLAKSFPEMADMNPAYRDITVTQLLSHTAGLPTLTEDEDLPAFNAATDAAGDDMKAKRAAVARAYLTKPPASKAGEFKYSNLGFIIAGAIAEARTGKVWEDLIREQVFALLGIENAGFSAPGTPGKADEPWGHNEVDGKLVPLDPADPTADNPPAVGPAGTINIALKDWALFAKDQIDGALGHGKLLKPETYRLLHTPVTDNYALGWGAKLGDDGVPEILTHSGSNGYWLAYIRIMPKEGVVMLVATNAGNDGANKTLRDIVKPLQDKLKPPPKP